MFSEASVSHSVHGEGLHPEGGLPPVLTSSGGHCSGRYASYWNAFLFPKRFVSLLLVKNKQALRSRSLSCHMAKVVSHKYK